MQTKQVLGIEIINRNAKEVYSTDSHMTEKWGIYGKGFSNEKRSKEKFLFLSSIIFIPIFKLSHKSFI